MAVIAILLTVVFWIAFVFFSFIPLLVAPIVGALACTGAFLLWVVLLVKAFQGMKFKLPWIGDLAERLSNG
ncbi:MAG: hypothetical protein ACRD2S_11135 [Terriglobales bacterium]